MKLRTDIKKYWKTILGTLLIGWAIGWGIVGCNTDKGKTASDTLQTNEVPAYLQWKKAGDLYAYYLGGKKGEVITFSDSFSWDKNQAIQTLYQKKFDRKNVNDYKVAKDHYDTTVSKKDFNDFSPISLNEYETKISNSLKKLGESLHRWEIQEKVFWNNTSQRNLLEHLAERIDENVITSYSMTELFPSTDGKYNKEFLRFLLQNAGEEYLSYLPAIHDDYTSFWPFQFTSYAVYDTWKEKRGASLFNQYVDKEEKIPGSVTLLKWEDHYKAAYLFILYNLSNLIKNKDWDIQKALLKLTEAKHKIDLAQLVAIMHNKPSNWRIFLKEWYQLTSNPEYLKKKQEEEKCNYDLNNNWNIDLYESFTGWARRLEQSHNYGKKTYSNFKALKSKKKQ